MQKFEWRLAENETWLIMIGDNTYSPDYQTISILTDELMVLTLYSSSEKKYYVYTYESVSE